MKQIQDISKSEGIPIERNNALRSYSFVSGVKEYTVCLSCEKIIGKWSLFNQVNIKKCDLCGHESYVLIGDSKKHVLEKIRIINSHSDK